ncbi:very short patch repair endonuclease [Oribacterium sp. FC2011]|uniref:very short patch repair endonuclease n=1 Tax=Oribacterium sp. FC2011 TaxID=1408311 RepID=UPI0005D18455|nr:very short patch repair endonuclease [Oribacterium sp. FC2011]
MHWYRVSFRKNYSRKNLFTEHDTNVHSKDTKIDVILRNALWHEGIRYRKNYTKIPGKPDIAITKYKIAVFCDSEFFHWKDWNQLKPRLEKSNNSDFWIKKISRNRERDVEVDRELRSLGWIVLRFWGAEIKKELEQCVNTIKEAVFIRKMEQEL